MQNLQKSLQKVNDKIIAPTKLLAVSKRKPLQMIEAAYELGQRDFGENHILELLEKSEKLKHLDIRWHMIGHIQSNKLNHLLKVKNLFAIHSIDSEKLLKKLLTKNVDSKIGLFLQVNISQEEQKFGFSSKTNFKDMIELINKHPDFFTQGFMGMSAIKTDNFVQDAHKAFRELRDLRNKYNKLLALKLQLSMGMSSDFQIAMEYGSDWVRIGSDIFGQRE